MIPEIKTVHELLDYKFYIPAYQRGYRWTPQEVGDFLDDIYEFDTGNHDKPRNYCLQPLIVKRREDGSFEVVDGQQRLTTILIFLKIAQKKTECDTYEIQFETREESARFLSALSDHDCSIIDDNIDYYYITNAHNRINSWLDEKSIDKTQRFNTLFSLFKKITDSVFFIWYEIPQNAKPVEIFTKANMGRIRLSNAELIKALIFNRENFSNNIESEQQELSLSWDRIERDLQKDSLWYFLVEDDRKEYETRIDLLFDLLAPSYNEQLPDALQIKLPVSPINYNRTFLVFYAAYKNSKDKHEFVIGLWKKVEEMHEQFLEWFDDLDKYHIIGYLICSGKTIEEVFRLSDGKRKSEIKSILISETRKTLKIDSFESLKKITYDDPKKKLRSLFLLMNISSLVCQKKKHYRFPFDLYKSEKWDIEHIHATADDSDEPDDTIGNLTLLQAKINRSYQDDEFSEKRKEIIRRDKLGMFIPLCTKNVFMKQYSNSDNNNLNEWNAEDKEGYIMEMWNTLDSFWKGALPDE